jgi:hypothetical protein
MNLPRPLVLFLTACGGAALFAAPLLLTAIAIGGAPPNNVSAAPSNPPATASEAPASDEIVGELTFHAFDLGFDPAMPEVDAPGRYSVTFINDGAILHDITFADGTVIAAEAGRPARSSFRLTGSTSSARSPGTRRPA